MTHLTASRKPPATTPRPSTFKSLLICELLTLWIYILLLVPLLNTDIMRVFH